MKKVFAGFAAFLVFMVVCTLVSRSVYAYRLPMVGTLQPEAKYIEHKVEAEGIVVAGGEKPVTYSPGFRIASLSVKEGDRVEAGEELFRIDLADLDEMMDEKRKELSRVSLQIDAILENQELARQKKELELARAREDYDTTARLKDTQVGRAMESYAQAEEELSKEGGDDALKEALQKAAYGEADAKAERDEAVKQAERKVEDILLPEDVTSDLEVARLEAAKYSDELGELQKIKNTQGVVTAPFGGVVTKIMTEAGGRVPDSAVMLLSDESLPCQLKVILDKEQKKYISLGDQISVKLEGQREELETQVDYLAESDEAADRYEVLVPLPEEMGIPGAAGTIARAEQGEKYSLCIPPAVLYEKDKRYYVYVLKEREGILGEEYYVEEVAVQVKDKNDNWAAIEEGALDRDSRIISSSTMEIKKGDVVRWEEE